MMKTVVVIERRSEKALSYEKKKNGGKSRQSAKRPERIELYVLNVARDDTRITINEMTWAAHVGLHRSLTSSFMSELVKISKVSTIKHFGTCTQGSCGTG